RKRPPLNGPLRQLRDPDHKPLKSLRIYADITVLVRLGGINIALVPRPLNSNRSLLKEIADLQSINLRFSQPAERHQVARQSLSFVKNGPRQQVLRHRHTTEARTI